LHAEFWHATARLSKGAKAIPVPLLVSGDEVDDLNSLAWQLLIDYGHVTDTALVRALLDRGGFLFILERRHALDPGMPKRRRPSSTPSSPVDAAAI